MNIKSKLLVFSLISLVGCLSNKQTNQVEAVSPVLHAVETPVFEEDKFIKTDGWVVPTPERRRKVDIRSVEDQTESKKDVSVTIITYAPSEVFLFKCCEPTENEKCPPITGELKLLQIAELRVGKSLFSYVISVKQMKLDRTENGNLQDNDILVYRIVDKDGDGKFETLLTKTSDKLVPDWVTK